MVIYTEMTAFKKSGKNLMVQLYTCIVNYLTYAFIIKIQMKDT